MRLLIQAEIDAINVKIDADVSAGGLAEMKGRGGTMELLAALNAEVTATKVPADPITQAQAAELFEDTEIEDWSIYRAALTPAIIEIGKPRIKQQLRACLKAGAAGANSRQRIGDAGDRFETYPEQLTTAQGGGAAVLRQFTRSHLRQVLGSFRQVVDEVTIPGSASAIRQAARDAIPAKQAELDALKAQLGGI